MAKYTKEQALKILVDNAKLYAQHLKNKDLLILYKVGSDINSCTITFRDYNYLHFTGVVTKLNAGDFYKRAYVNTLTVNDFDFKDEFTTFKKYDVISNAMKIAYNAKSIGQFGNQGVKIKADAGIGTVAYVMTLGQQDDNFYYPKGILKEDVRNVTYNSSPIVAIFSKKVSDKLFDIITYKSKNINIDKLHFPKNITSLLTPEALYELKPSLQIKTADKTQASELNKNAINTEDISADVPKENPKGIFNRIRNITLKKNSQTERSEKGEPHSKIDVNDSISENIAKDERNVKPKLTLEERLAQASKKADELNNKSQPENIKTKNNKINLD